MTEIVLSPQSSALSPEAQRSAVVAEARSWIGTPYHHEGRIKGPRGGVDCGMLIYEVYRACDLIPETQIEPYSAQFHLHRSEEQYLAHIQPFGAEIEPDSAGPGDVVVFKMGRCFSHAGIVIAWPKIVHAFARAAMVVEDDVTQPYFKKYERKSFSLWATA